MFLGLKELKYSLKKHWGFYILSISFLSLITIVISVSIFMMSQTFIKEKSITNTYHNSTIYRIIDTFYEDEDFQEFRSNKANINKIGSFYNDLFSNESIELLSVFDQPLDIENYLGNKAFWDNEMAMGAEYNIKSLQMNKNVFDFNKLKVMEGIEPEWEMIKASDKVIPIILGYDYSNIYNIGDKLKGKYYNQEVVFHVVGILEKNQMIYYQNNIEFYVDRYILVPYPYICDDLTDDNNQEVNIFKSVLYFAMINSDVVMTNESENIHHILDQISIKSNFYNYTLLGESPIKTQYSQIISSIQSNQVLLVVLNLSFFCFLLLIQSNILLLLKKSRRHFHILLNEIGLIRNHNLDIFVYLFPYVVSLFIGVIFTKLYLSDIMTIIVFELIVLHIIIYCLSHFVVKKVGKSL